MSTARKIEPFDDILVAGNFSKKDGGEKIGEGVRHLFSTPDDSLAPLIELTEKSIKKNVVPRYPWEPLLFKKIIHLKSSIVRSSVIDGIVASLKIEKKRDLRERVEGVLEELLTNAIYHANRLPDGDEKYNRNTSVNLEEHERITISYAQKGSGIYLSVVDSGGKFDFSQLSSAFARCYGLKGVCQIESKESGAGLGIFLVFESATHLKISVKKNRETRISCWVSTERAISPGGFSFNFYYEE